MKTFNKPVIKLKLLQKPRLLKPGAFLGVVIFTMLLLSHFWVSGNYNEMEQDSRFIHPGKSHLLGTDNFGRDIFSRIMAGGRNSLLLAVCTVAGAAAAGSILGLLSGYLGGIADEIIMRITDALNSFPGILLALFFVAVMGNGQFTLFIALLFIFTPGFTRIMRTCAMQYKNASFVQSERIIGAGLFRIIFIHILPNAAPSLLSASVFGLSNAILAEAAMSYLGMGIQPPEPSWGRMLFEAQGWFFNAPWCAIAPGLSIMITVVIFHLWGEEIGRNFGGQRGSFA